jgi:putative transposase
MPRQARIDAPDALHHVIARGIERSKIYRDDVDREDFLRKLGNLVQQTETKCYAWALIPSHFHLLLKTGKVPIATIMLRLLTGYAAGYNRRHRRNRFLHFLEISMHKPGVIIMTMLLRGLNRGDDRN